VQFGTGAVHIIPVSSCDIHENRSSESRSLLSAVKDILPIFFLQFSSDLEKISTGNVHKTVFIDLRLVKVVTVKAILYLGDVYAFLSVVSYEICT
jgi:hypothetical protein